MFRRKSTTISSKVLCYVLIYGEASVIRRSLDSITGLSDYLDIVLIENPSDQTPEVSTFIQHLADKGKISAHYLFDHNISNNAYNTVLTAELARIRRSPFVIVSDGDLEINKPKRWLHEAEQVMKHSEVFACGISLSKANLPLKAFPEADQWIPPDINSSGPYIEARTGCHLLFFRGKELAKFLDWSHHQKSFFVDGELHRFCYEVLGKKWARTKNEAYHITWDLYSDTSHPYTRQKLDKSFRQTWYHRDESDFTLTRY